MTTQMHRIFSVLMVALMVGLVAAGWFLVAQPQLAAAATSADQLTAVTAQTAQSQTALAQLKAEKGKLADLQTQLTGLQASIPSDLASSPLVSGLNDEAASAGVFILNITVNDATSYAPAGATTSGTNAGSAPTGASSSPAPTPSATPSAAPAAPVTPASAGFSPMTNALITAANFIPVPVAITVKGGWDQTLAFVKNLQSGSRLYAVSTAGSKRDQDDTTQYQTTITGFVFAIVSPGQAAAAKDAATPSPSPTAKPTKKPAPTASTSPIPSSSSTPSDTPSR